MSKYLPAVHANVLREKQQSQNYLEYYELLTEPLHEELYRRQDFNFLDDLSQGQQMLLSYDYVQVQVNQGGFIQLIQNGYVSLLADLPEWLIAIGAPAMGKVIDDALKVYVLNRELLDKPATVEEFALLYEELKEFELLDTKFNDLDEITRKAILQYATEHIDEFVAVI